MARTQSAPAGALPLVGAWILVSVVAEAAAVALALLLFATTALGALDAALLEGLLLGFGQRFVLRGTGRDAADGWIVATLAGAVAGRLVEFAADGSTLAGTLSHASPAAQYLAGAGLGLAVGALMAVPQAFVLRRRVHGAWRWIAARAGAWGLALPLLGAGAAFTASWPASAVAPLVVGLVAAVAVVVGAIEGLAMRALTAP